MPQLRIMGIGSSSWSEKFVKTFEVPRLQFILLINQPVSCPFSTFREDYIQKAHTKAKEL